MSKRLDCGCILEDDGIRYWCRPSRGTIDCPRAALAAAERERDRLREALRMIAERDCYDEREPPDAFSCRCDVHIARSALAQQEVDKVCPRCLNQRGGNDYIERCVREAGHNGNCDYEEGKK